MANLRFPYQPGSLAQWIKHRGPLALVQARKALPSALSTSDTRALHAALERRGCRNVAVRPSIVSAFLPDDAALPETGNHFHHLTQKFRSGRLELTGYDLQNISIAGKPHTLVEYTERVRSGARWKHGEGTQLARTSSMAISLDYDATVRYGIAYDIFGHAARHALVEHTNAAIAESLPKKWEPRHIPLSFMVGLCQWFQTQAPHSHITHLTLNTDCATLDKFTPTLHCTWPPHEDPGFSNRAIRGAEIFLSSQQQPGATTALRITTPPSGPKWQLRFSFSVPPMHRNQVLAYADQPLLQWLTARVDRSIDHHYRKKFKPI